MEGRREKRGRKMEKGRAVGKATAKARPDRVQWGRPRLGCGFEMGLFEGVMLEQRPKG